MGPGSMQSAIDGFRRWTATLRAGARRLLGGAGLASALTLCACGGGGAGSPAAPALASGNDTVIAGYQPGVSPFISFVQLRGSSLEGVSSLRYTIDPQPGSASRAVNVTYTLAALGRRGYTSTDGRQVTVPVFGLYAGYANHVTIALQFIDGSGATLSADIATAPYVDPKQIYDRPVLLTKRDPGTALGFDFVLIKSGVGSPVIIDSDGAPRWVGTGFTDSGSSIFHENAFLIGDAKSARLSTLELDGSMASTFLIAPSYDNFHHNIDRGKHGLLVEVTTHTGSVMNIESTLAEVTPAGAVLKEWDMAALLGDYMRSQGDDPTTFIRPGIDWFHMNAALYDPRDDSIIVSSRENFVVNLDYTTGTVRWILGDPTKYWYTFPSLRAKSLTLSGDGLYPIGQHAVSIASDGSLMLFNNGAPSFNQPSGAAVGESRTFSALSAFSIDIQSRTVRETWRFEHGRSILSPICSSVYEEPSDKSLLANYATADNFAFTRLVALNAAHDVVFDFQYAAPGPCQVGWNATPIHLEDLRYVY